MWGAKGQALPPWLRSLPTLRRKARSGPNRRQNPVGTRRSLASRYARTLVRRAVAAWVEWLRNGPAGDDPSCWLSGDLRDQVVVAVVVQHGDLFSLGYGGDQQAGESDCPDLPVAPERGLDIERAAPVLIVGGEPFVAGVAVGAQFIELCAGPGGPSELELDDAAGGYQPGLDQRAQHHGHRLVPQARQRAGVRQVAGYRCHAERITCSSSRSGRPPETRRCRSLRRAASAATARRAALTVSFLVSVCSACWAAARYSSSTSMRVLAISTSLCRISH